MGQDSDFGLTVRECLTIPPLDAGTVAAGAAGLSRRLRWVHVVDHNDVESALMGGELVLTSGVTLGHDSGLQRAIFPIMRRRDVAALVIALGPYMDHVPQPMRDDAERFAIPLIALPWAVNFRDVTHALLTRLVQSSYAFLEGAERLNRDLLDIVMRRGGLAAVCARLAAQLGRGVAITDPAFQMLASQMLPRPNSPPKGRGRASCLPDPACPPPRWPRCRRCTGRRCRRRPCATRTAGRWRPRRQFWRPRG